jgi:hypothetical protein
MANTIKVRATEVTYYNEARRRIGDVFTLVPRRGTFTEVVLDKNKEPKLDKLGFKVTREVEKTLSAAEQFNPKCMVRVPDDTPEKITTGKQVLQEQHDAINRAKLGLGDPPTTATGDASVIT